jgi:hypothetical protein
MGGWNPYQYPLNPVTDIDPLGLYDCDTYTQAHGAMCTESGLRKETFPIDPLNGFGNSGGMNVGGVGSLLTLGLIVVLADLMQNDENVLTCPSCTAMPMAAPGNQADTGIQKLVDSLISERGQSTGKKPSRCEMLEELIANGEFTAKEANSTMKAWGCKHSRHCCCARS